MIPSAKIIAFIRDFEKCRLKAFKPTPNDVWTLGWGATGPDIREGMTWTQAQADARFAADLARFSGKVSGLLGAASTTQAQYDALVSFSYNIGYGDGGLKTSTLLRMHKAGDYAGAALQFSRWDKQAGKSLAGLTRRRAEEAAIYRGAT